MGRLVYQVGNNRDGGGNNMIEISGHKNCLYYFQNIHQPHIFIEVVTYFNDGHFYYKKYTKDTYDDFKLKRIRKDELYKMLEDYQIV